MSNAWNDHLSVKFRALLPLLCSVKFYLFELRRNSTISSFNVGSVFTMDDSVVCEDTDLNQAAATGRSSRDVFTATCCFLLELLSIAWVDRCSVKFLDAVGQFEFCAALLCALRFFSSCQFEVDGV